MGELNDYIRDEVYGGEPVLTMSLHDLAEILTRVSVNAIARYESIREPKSDMMKQGEAKRYIASRGFKTGQLRKWLDEGLIHAEKPSESQNGAVWYSKAEIENAIVSVGMVKVVMKDALYHRK